MNPINTFFKFCSHKVDNYQLASGLFLKLLAMVYFSAFLSLVVQISGLVGSNGILPFSDLLDHSYQQQGIIAWLYRPTLFWIDSSDLSLKAISLTGCFISLFLFVGFQVQRSLIFLFILYLSLFHAGQVFLSFQWDTLLLEAGFLAIFIKAGPSRLLLFLFHWLLFRLRFMSGISKLGSDDPSWSGLTALNYYFESQPLPHIGAWYFHQLPEWILQIGVIFMFITELIVPFFIFLPRKFRLFAAFSTILMQLFIISTSNHNWINLLTILLCLFLLDDKLLQKIIPKSIQGFTSLNRNDVSSSYSKSYALPVFALLILLSSLSGFVGMVSSNSLLKPIEKNTQIIRLWGIGHIYHLFPTMQTERHELQIEGSYDGVNWKSYGFKYKPGALEKRPEFILPHQPRLDWMVWFVPPRFPEMLLWFDRFLYKLWLGSDEVNDLLGYNPFPNEPPNYLRVQVFRYRCTTFEERARTGQWWKREYMGLFPYVKPRYP